MTKLLFFENKKKKKQMVKKVKCIIKMYTYFSLK